jgi:hypothetical protein
VPRRPCFVRDARFIAVLDWTVSGSVVESAGMATKENSRGGLAMARLHALKVRKPRCVAGGESPDLVGLPKRLAAVLVALDQLADALGK